MELVRGECIEAQTITMNDAETAVADTLQLSRNRKGAQALGVVILTLIGLLCIGLLWMLVTDGSIVAYSVGSLVAGLIAWAAPVWHMTLAKRTSTALPSLVSLTGAMTALGIQLFQISHEVDTGDWSAIMDTIYALCLVAVLFSAVTLLLNGLMYLFGRGK